MWKQGVNGNGEILRDWYIEHEPVDLVCPPEEGMTRQEFAQECDINVLLARYESSGAWDRFNMREPLYLDVSDVPDLQGALHVLDQAREAFMRLPATTRREFENDPVQFVAFAEDPRNLPRMREWGLARPEEPVGSVSRPAPGPGGDPAPNAPAASLEPRSKPRD